MELKFKYPKAQKLGCELEEFYSLNNFLNVCDVLKNCTKTFVSNNIFLYCIQRFGSSEKENFGPGSLKWRLSHLKFISSTFIRSLYKTKLKKCVVTFAHTGFNIICIVKHLII